MGATEKNSHYHQIEQVEQALLQIGWLSQRQFMQILATERFDLTVPQYYALLHLYDCPSDCRMSDLARATHLSAASLTGVIDRLVEKRLVVRFRSEDDRRQVVVCVNDEGRALLEEIKHTHRMHLRHALSEIASDEVDHLLNLLDAMVAGMLRTIEERRV